MPGVSLPTAISPVRDPTPIPNPTATTPGAATSNKPTSATVLFHYGLRSVTVDSCEIKWGPDLKKLCEGCFTNRNLRFMTIYPSCNLKYVAIICVDERWFQQTQPHMAPACLETHNKNYINFGINKCCTYSLDLLRGGAGYSWVENGNILVNCETDEDYEGHWEDNEYQYWGICFRCESAQKWFEQCDYNSILAADAQERAYLSLYPGSASSDYAIVVKVNREGFAIVEGADEVEDGVDFTAERLISWIRRNNAFTDKLKENFYVKRAYLRADLQNVEIFVAIKFQGGNCGPDSQLSATEMTDDGKVIELHSGLVSVADAVAATAAAAAADASC
jgi:hypothetical protein